MQGRAPVLEVEGLSKSFVLHLQGARQLRVLESVAFTVSAGECLALVGPSGAGKSTLMRALYGNYRAGAGRILLRGDAGELDIAAATPQEIIAARRRTIGYVSQFLRVIPRVPALTLVAEPARRAGLPEHKAVARARALLARLNLPERLWDLPPATFSGGEQQRVNLARGFAVDYPLLLLDEPTASLDPMNRAAVVGLIEEAKARGAALVGIFHDAEVREAVATRTLAILPLPTGAR